MSKVLFICNSAYQLMTAAQLRNTRYTHDQVDLILSDQLAGAEQIAQNEGSKMLFDRVEYVENKKQKFASRLHETLHDLRLIRRLHRRLGEYDIVCISNISVFTILFYRFYQSRRFELNFYEDGFITYCEAFVDMDRASAIARWINPQGLLGSASHLFLYNPQLLEWHRPGIEVVAIDKIDADDRSFVHKLNSLFDYNPESPSVDKYDKPYIFLEESFFADNYAVDDVSYVEELGNVVGRENVMIKLHPRNPENRFEKRGFKTNHNYAVPWELILMNTSLKDVTLISISSCAILQPYLLLGQRVRSIALIRMLEQRPGNMRGKLGLFMISLFERFPEVCSCPQTKEEFFKQLMVS